MERSELENISLEVEMLARMWIKCDPNRADDADELQTLYVDGVAEEHPRWMWFIPRAVASIAFFKAQGFALASPPTTQRGHSMSEKKRTQERTP